MCSTACPRCQQGGGPWYQTRTCFLGSDCHRPGSRVSPGDCICHRPSWGRARQYVQCHPRTTTASVCPSAPVQHPHTRIHPHPFFPCRTGPHLSHPKDCSREVSCVPGRGTSCSLGWLGNVQAIRALSNWGGTGSSSNTLTHPTLRRHPPHLWSLLVLSISGWKPPEVKGT